MTSEINSGNWASERERATEFYGWALGIYTPFGQMPNPRDLAYPHAAKRKNPLGWQN